MCAEDVQRGSLKHGSHSPDTCHAGTSIGALDQLCGAIWLSCDTPARAAAAPRLTSQAAPLLLTLLCSLTGWAPPKELDILHGYDICPEGAHLAGSTFNDLCFPSCPVTGWPLASLSS